MKNNQNDKRRGDYYLGLDVGTDSAGWAVTDKDYNLLKCNGKQMWGARLFSEANSAADRRTARTSRRRLERRKQRLNLLEMLLNNDIAKLDPSFFVRFHDSNLWAEDKHDTSCKYSLFNDSSYTDKDYLKEYPTIYHLRSELIHSSEPHDIRLVYLALHHILKSRGHFLYENSNNPEGKTLEEATMDLVQLLKDNDIEFSPNNRASFAEALISSEGITHKKEELANAYGESEKDEEAYVDLSSLIDLLSGASVKLDKLFNDPELKEADLKVVSLKEDLDSKFDQLSEELEDRIEVILTAKEVYDVARLGQVLGGNRYISDAKVALFNKNKKDLSILKRYVKKNCPEKYKDIFNEQKDVKNYAAYSRYKTDSRCTQEEFCTFISKKVGGMKVSDDPEEQRVYEEISNKVFLTKLKGTENGLIPFQLNLKELVKILDNASGYWNALNEKGSDGITIKDKIIALFTFKIPYYVGPLNKNAKHYWAVRTDERIYPWNFTDVVDEKKTAENFIKNLIGKCTYTGEDVLPMNSLLYSEYAVLNEINNIKVNGKEIPVEVKKSIYNDLFLESSKKVTKKKIYNYLLANGYIEKMDEISGVDDEIKSNLKSWHDFRNIIEKTKDTQQVESIIERVLVFGKDKKMLKTWLKDNTHGLDNDDYKMIMRLNYKDWGRLSREFLEDIYHVDSDGEAFNIITMLRDTNQNLMMLLSSHYQFAEKADEYRHDHFSVGESLHERLEEMYIAPAVRRSIWQTMRVVDEIVDIEKSAPKKIFIEMARTSSKEMEKKRTISRKNVLMQLYASCKKQESELYGKLQSETDQSLRRDKLYLYYTQMGRCMYSGDPIDLDKLLHDDTTYDIDHIFPRSRIKDDSLDNRVLVKSKLNRDKTNDYPLSDDVRKRMESFWKMLSEKKLISTEKYSRLIRNYPLTDEELSSFVARQLTVTQQSTKALAEILNQSYPSAKIVYSKAGNVSEFRQKYEIPKFRDVNDMHHAKDAYLNIVVGNVYSTKFTDQFFKNIHSENYSLNRVFEFSTPSAWTAPSKEKMEQYQIRLKNKDINAHDILDGTFKTVYKYVYKNTPIVTFAQFQTKGVLFDLTIKGKNKGQQPIKKNLDISKYGGYNNRYAAYYFIAEFNDTHILIRKILPVYIDSLKEYETNPLNYCANILNLNEPKIVIPKLRANSLLELNGVRYRFTGRSNESIICQHDYQLAIDDKHAKYLKLLNKNLISMKLSKGNITDYNNDISIEKNTLMFDWMVEKLLTNTYQCVFSGIVSKIVDKKPTFLTLDVISQAVVLTEMLKLFKCNSLSSNLQKIGLGSNVGKMNRNSKISSYSTAYLINQSATGLFEVKQDLLESCK